MDETLKIIFQIIGIAVTSITILGVIVYVIYHKTRDIYDNTGNRDQYGNDLPGKP